jgi:WD40 repeat protein
MAFDFLKNLDADDIFISYSREDGSAYLTGLDAALSARGFSCFTDKRGTDADRLPPKTLFRKIRLCKTLVLLATPGALRKPENIAPEVSEFAEANGTSRIVCVSFDRGAELADWSQTPWFTHVEGKSREREDPEALKTGEPSPAIVETIAAASGYMKSKDRLRKYRDRAISVLALLVVSIVAAAIVAGVMINRANAATAKAAAETGRAAQATRDATQALAQAKTARDEALAAKAEAETAKADATQQRRLADLATKDAEAKTKLADAATRKAQAAEAQAQAAQAQAKLQQTIADSRSLANRSGMLLRWRPEELREGASLALRSMEASKSAGAHLLEADTALRDSLALLPHLRHDEESDAFCGPGENVFSPDGLYFSAGTGEGRLGVFEAKSRTPLGEVPFYGGDHAALSNGGAYAAVASTDQTKIFQVKSGKLLRAVKPKQLPYRMALSPGGRYLAVVYGLYRMGCEASSADVIDTTTNEVIKTLGDDPDMKICDVAFGPTGDLALGGYDTGPRGGGHALIWPLSQKLRAGGPRGEFIDGDVPPPVNAYLDESISVIAPGADATYFVTDKAVWRRAGSGNRYEPVTTVPATKDEWEHYDYHTLKAFSVVSLALSSQDLKVIRCLMTPGTTPRESQMSLEVLDAAGHREEWQVSHSRPFSAVGFSRDGRQVAAEVSWAQESALRLFRADDASEVKSRGPEPTALIEYTAPDVGYVVTSGFDFATVTEQPVAHVWDVYGSEEFPVPYDGDFVRLRAATITPDGEFLALAGTGPGESDFGKGRVVVYRSRQDSRTGKRSYVKFLTIPFDSTPGKMALAPGGLLATTNSEGTTVRDISDPQNVREVTPAGLRELTRKDIANLRFSPRGHYIAASLDLPDPDWSDKRTSPLEVRTWRVADRTELPRLKHTKWLEGFYFSGDERYLLTAGQDRRALLLDLSAGGKPKELRADAQIESAALSPDGRYFALGTTDGVLQVYETRDPENEIARLPHDGRVTAVVFSRDGRRVATATERGERPGVVDDERYAMRVWLLQPDDLMTEVKRRRDSLPAHVR